MSVIHSRDFLDSYNSYTVRLLMTKLADRRFKMHSQVSPVAQASMWFLVDSTVRNLGTSSCSVLPGLIMKVIKDSKDK